MAPLFTVIIPVYNRQAYVRRCVESVLSQRMSDFELIVVDDGSRDQTVPVVRAMADADARIRLIEQANAGPGPARNRAIAAARGRYVAFLDSDDLWFPWTLACYAEVNQKAVPVSFISGCWEDFRQEQELDRLKDLDPAPKFTRFADYFAAGSSAGVVLPSAVCVETEALRATGGFPDDRLSYEGMHLCLKLGVAEGYARLQHPPLVARRFHESNLCQDHQATFDGLERVIKLERAGAYPGNPSRWTERQRQLTPHVRSVSLSFLENGHRCQAWALYRRSFLWHLRLGRWKYLIGFPVRALISWRSRRRAVP